MLSYCLVSSFLPTTKGVEEGLRSLTVSAIVTVDAEAWMSSCDGAVMRMAGGRGKELVESDSVLDSDGGGLTVTEREKMTLKYERWKIHTDYDQILVRYTVHDSFVYML